MAKSTAKKTAFALFFGNREFFPASLQAGARREMKDVLEGLGHKVLMLDEKATRHGAVETPEEGRIYASFLRQHAGEFGGVIVCLPNFGDETGAVCALKDAGVPILIQAYPDDLDKMSPDLRRDAFCGKFSVMNIFYQYGMKFTALKPHTVYPKDARFAENVDYFDRLCRVVNGMRGMVVGSVGARTTAFKTVRIDELALQRAGINMETIDLSHVFDRMEKLDAKACQEKAKTLGDYIRWEGVPEDAKDKVVRLGVVLDELIHEYGMNALGLRCWIELQQQLSICPCVVMSELNNRSIPAACEVDIGNAITMYALHLASGDVAACMDWNNNYGDDDNKCILFHCGAAPQSMLRGKGHVECHAMLARAVGPEHSWGCNTERFKPTPFTYGSLTTENGKLKFYLGQGRYTDDPIADDFFGCAGVAAIENLQTVLQTVGQTGHRHHMSITPGHVLAPIKEAFEKYLGFEVNVP
ncbi:MAG: hypothetical protein HQ546_01325 [Planctomycetes bacterium]|nr:hypothetical protein [Planctomycetota bacterium]